MGGEARAAHTGDTGILDDLNDLRPGQRFHVLPALDGGIWGVLEIVFDDHRHHHSAAAVGPGLHGHYLAGHTGVDGRAQTGGLADERADLHLVPRRHNGLAGSAHVHGHGDDHLGRRLRHGCGGLVLGQILVLGGMYSAEKLMQHSLTSIFSLSLPQWNFTNIYIIVEDFPKVQPQSGKKMMEFLF